MTQLRKNTPTPDGLLIWSYVFSPDTTSRYADNKYKVNHRYFGEEAVAVKKLLDNLAEQACKSLGCDKLDNALYSVPKDKDKKEIEGAIEVKFKTTKAPTIVDGKKQRLQRSDVPGYKDNCQLGTGVVVFNPYEQNISGKNYLTLYLQAIQIKDLSTGSVDMSLFEEVEDGFVADTNTVSNDEGAVDDMPDFASK